jgi:hypothetical protein
MTTSPDPAVTNWDFDGRRGLHCSFCNARTHLWSNPSLPRVLCEQCKEAFIETYKMVACANAVEVERLSALLARRDEEFKAIIQKVKDEEPMQTSENQAGWRIALFKVLKELEAQSKPDGFSASPGALEVKKNG